MPETDPWLTPPSSFGKLHDWDGTSDRPILLMEDYTVETRQDIFSEERGNDDESRVVRSVASGSGSDEELLGYSKRGSMKGLRGFLGGVRNTLQGRKKKQKDISPINSDQEDLEAKISDDIVDVHHGGLQAFASDDERDDEFFDGGVKPFNDTQFTANIFRNAIKDRPQRLSVRSPSPSRLEQLARERNVHRRSPSPRSQIQDYEQMKSTGLYIERVPSHNQIIVKSPVTTSNLLQQRASYAVRKNSLQSSSPVPRDSIVSNDVIRDHNRHRHVQQPLDIRAHTWSTREGHTREPTLKPSTLSSRGRDLYFASKESHRKKHQQDPGHVNTKKLSSDDSLGSDIQRLRSILRRSQQRRQLSEIQHTDVPMMQISAPDYLAVMADDPMHRAGLRLLTAAVIPIQCAIRRHLALREALSRMWAIVVVQTTFRAYRVRRDFRVKRHAAVRIQSVYRGACVRENLLVQHCCAMEIQRHIRGYLATLKVFERVYKITLLQSIVRRKLAMDLATDRMVLVIQLQSLVRRFHVRRRLTEEHIAATKIQANWRSFSCSFNYELDIMDIVTVQSLVRRRLAVRKYIKMQDAEYGGWAKVIQKIVHGFITRKEYQRRREAAITIQSHWRAFNCSISYLHLVARVIIVQSTVRRFLVKLRQHKLKYAKEHAAATKISSLARVIIGKKTIKNIAVTRIQTSWRRFVAYADYIFTLADIVAIQSLARRWLMRKKLQSMKQVLIVESLNRYKEVGLQENAAAIMIQKHWRGFVCAMDFTVWREERRAAFMIQSAWRRFWCFSNYIITLDSVVRIQAIFRGHIAYTVYEEKLGASILIQTAIRGFQARRYTSAMRLALTMIDEGLVYSKVDRAAATRIQAIVRGGIARYFVRFDKSAVHIQSLWRGYYVRLLQCQYQKARLIQKIWRGRQECKDYKRFIAARLIQKNWRGRQVLTGYKSFFSARIIQNGWRRKAAQKLLRQHTAARSIQTCWRRDHLEVRFAATVEAIRSRWFDAAITIQRWTRGHHVRCCIGSYTCSTHALRFQSCYARDVQRVWRGFHQRMTYWRKLGSVLQIQRVARGFLARKIASLKIQKIVKSQTVARIFLARLEAKQRFIICMLMQQSSSTNQLKIKASTSTTVSNSDWLGISEKQRRVESAARTIQCFFRMVKTEVDREIRAAKRRHRARRNQTMKIKKGNMDQYDDTLENVWRSYSMTSEMSKDPRQVASSVQPLLDNNQRQKHRVPTAYSEIHKSHHKKIPQKLYIRTDYEDEASTIMSSRTARSRLSPQDRDMEYALETAFLDAQIQDAKKRRKHRKKRTALV